MDDKHLRKTFDANAQAYNEARPSYPDALFDRLIKACNLSPDSRLLEIGPGTGQATKAMAKRGYAIVAIELGEDLARMASKELGPYSNVEVRTGAFEEADLPSASFDLVYAATAFHWINPALRFTKPHALLKPDGHLAVIGTSHVSDEHGDEFFYASQPIYDTAAGCPAQTKGGGAQSLPLMHELTPTEVDTTLFEPVLHAVYPLIVEYSASEYIKLIGTYSPTLAMAPETRKTFLNSIADLISTSFGGSVTKHYAMALTISKKFNR